MKPSQLRALDTIARGMITNPTKTVAEIASDKAFAHLGENAPDEVARALGFDSFADIDVKFAEYKRDTKFADEFKRVTADRKRPK